MPRNLRWPVIALIAGAVGLAIPMVAVADNAPTNNKTFVYQVGLWATFRTRRCRRTLACRTSSLT